MKQYFTLGGVFFAFFVISSTAATRYVVTTNAAASWPYLNWATAATNIQSAIDAAAVGDLIMVSNGIYSSGGAGVVYGQFNRIALKKAVTVQSVNGPEATVIRGNANASRCAYLTNGAVLSGFTLTNGSVGGGDIIYGQSGAGVWCESDAAVVTNCIIVGGYAQYYGGGAYQGTLNNCVISNNTAFIQGGGAYRATLNNCVISSNQLIQGFGGGGAALGVLNDCILTRNFAFTGGGAISNVLNRCMVSNNAASQGGGVAFGVANYSLIISNYASQNGGGAYSNALNHCLVSKNRSEQVGGGAYNSVLWSSTVVSNYAVAGPGTASGVQGGSATNSIVYHNSASSFGNYVNGTIFSHCCTTPLPSSGIGNFINEPGFVDVAGGNYRLKTNSACINSGNSGLVTNLFDFDGNPRVVGSAVDAGAFEFQYPGASLIPYAFLLQNLLPTDGSADFVDTDGDGMNNWQEWRAGTFPRGSASCLKIVTPPVTNNSSGITVIWQSVKGINYFIQRSTDLSLAGSFSTIASNLVGQTGTTSYLDAGATGGTPCFYRVGVP